MNLHTFGKTPAALYLARLVIDLNNEKVSRKVTRTLTQFRRTINEMYAANRSGILSTGSLGTLLASTKQAVLTQTAILKQHEPEAETIFNLTANLLIGEIKSLQRGCPQSRRLERKLKHVCRVSVVSDAEETIPQLYEKSKQKLTARGKPCFLY